MNIRITKKKFIIVAGQHGISREVAGRLYDRISVTAAKPVKERKVRKPKLSAIKNPNSKYYDEAPKLTRKLSLVFYIHQRNRSRFKHKRIGNNDRQWVLLVQIKDAILEVTGPNEKKFMTFSRKLFDEAEQISQRIGKRNLYLSFVVSMLPELVDRTSDRIEAKLTKREKRAWRAYRVRRERLTGIELDPDLEPGSDEHMKIKEIVEIMRRYEVSTKLFMDVHFKAFGNRGTFPRLKDLTTVNAIDRLEQYLVQFSKEEEGEEEYWKDVKAQHRKQSRSKRRR